jgi:hypothetical protein
MERYKSIYSEAFKPNKIVNISKLQWKKTNERMTWDEAISNTPSGWRLPTIQELYSYMINVYNKDDKSYELDSTFWSSTKHPKNQTWAYYTLKTDVFIDGIGQIKHNVIYVK